MSGIEGEVLDQFFDALMEDEQVVDSMAERLKPLLDAERLPSAAALAELFASASGETVA